MECGIKMLWDAHEQTKLAIQNQENQKPVEAPKCMLKGTTINTVSTTVAKEATSVFVELLSGPHQGKTYALVPTRRKACFIGRSKGKDCRAGGISLYKDLEVSTKHGKIMVNTEGKICFVDTDSTNGTQIGGRRLAPEDPVEIIDGMEILCGQTLMKMTLIS